MANPHNERGPGPGNNVDPEFLLPVKRHVQDIVTIAGLHGAILITGPRGVRKTDLLGNTHDQMAKGWRFPIHSVDANTQSASPAMIDESREATEAFIDEAEKKDDDVVVSLDHVESYLPGGENQDFDEARLEMFNFIYALARRLHKRSTTRLIVVANQTRIFDGLAPDIPDERRDLKNAFINDDRQQYPFIGARFKPLQKGKKPSQAEIDLEAAERLRLIEKIRRQGLTGQMAILDNSTDEKAALRREAAKWQTDEEE